MQEQTEILNTEKQILNIEKIGDEFNVNINDFSIEDMNCCFSKIIAEVIFREYPDDPQFLIGFYTVFLLSAQDYLNKLKADKKENIYGNES